MDSCLALIDADFLLYYTTHLKKDDEGNPIEKSFEEITNEAEFYFARILTALNTDNYVAAFTSRSFRYDVYPDYKGNRKDGDKPKFFQELKEYCLKKLKFTYNLGYEADDIVNILKRDPKFYCEDEDQKIIVSNDKDLLKLEGTHFDPVKNRFVETDVEEAELYFWTSMITGDSTDNIKGIPGKGVKFAEGLFQVKDQTIVLPGKVLDSYYDYYGNEGVQEFYKNYKCLKVLDKPMAGFKYPEVQQFKYEE